MNTDNAYYWSITETKRQAVLVRSEIERLTSKFFFDRDFIFVEPPVLHEAIANKKSEIYIPLYNGKYSLSLHASKPRCPNCGLSKIEDSFASHNYP